LDTGDRIRSLTRDLDAGLEVQEWTAGHLQKMEDVVSRLQSLDPEEASYARQRVHTHFASSIRDSFRQIENLNERDLLRIQSALEVLVEHNRTLADQLQREFHSRLQQAGREIPSGTSEARK
jgi:hypothetical protein